MSANLLVPNSYYTVYCKNVVSSDSPIAAAETWCYYPSNPTGQGQNIVTPVPSQKYPISYNVSAISKNVVVNDDGTIDIVQEGIYRLECSYSLLISIGGGGFAACSAALDRTISGTTTNIYTAPTTNVNANNYFSMYYTAFFTIPKGNTVPVKITTSVFVTTANVSSLILNGAGLSLQRIDEAPTPPPP